MNPDLIARGDAGLAAGECCRADRHDVLLREQCTVF